MNKLYLLSGVLYVLSFANQLLIAFYFGTSSVLDSYYAFLGFSGMLLFTVNPVKDGLYKVFYGLLRVSTNEASIVLSSALLLQSFIVSTLVVLLSLDFIRLPLFDWLNLDNSRQFLFLFMPYLFIIGLAEILSGTLLALNKLISQVILRLISAVISVFSLFLLAPDYGFFALVFSLFIGQLVLFVGYLLLLKTEEVNLFVVSPFGVFKNSSFLKVFSAMIFVFFAAQAYVLFERFLMLDLQPGFLSSYQLSVMLVNVGISILVHPNVNFIGPRLLLSEEERNYKELYGQAFSSITFLLIPLLFGCVFVFFSAEDIVKMLFYRGNFDFRSVQMTSDSLRSTIFTALPIAVYSVLTKVLMILEESRALAVSSVVMSTFGVFYLFVVSYYNLESLLAFHWFIGNSAGAIVVVFYVIRKSRNFNLLFSLNYSLLLRWISLMVVFISILLVVNLIFVNNVIFVLPFKVVFLLILIFSLYKMARFESIVKVN